MSAISRTDILKLFTSNWGYDLWNIITAEPAKIVALPQHMKMDLMKNIVNASIN